MDAGLARSLGPSYMSSPGMSELTMDSERVAQSPLTELTESPAAQHATPGTTPCYPVLVVLLGRTQSWRSPRIEILT